MASRATRHRTVARAAPVDRWYLELWRYVGVYIETTFQGYTRQWISGELAGFEKSSERQ